jgi:peptide/nickel transport system permease protein
MNFFHYLLRRVLFSIPLLLGITLVTFLITNVIPADPVTANLPQNALNNEEIVRAFRAKWGLDRPLTEQYLTYMKNLLRGDLGISIRTKRPVIEDIRAFFPATIELATVGILFGMTFGVLIGVASAIWRNGIIDYLTRMAALLGVSFPVFVLALLGLTLLYARWGLVSGPGRLDFKIDPPPQVTGMYTVDSLLDGDFDKFRNALSHLLLPGLVLASYSMGIIARVTRSAMLEAMSEDYIRTARAKGLSEYIVVLRHGLRNAMIPVITVIGLSYANLLTGAVLTESIFAWQGIGRYVFRASVSQDFPAIMGISLLFALIYLGVNFVVDILYFWVDPRIRKA